MKRSLAHTVHVCLSIPPKYSVSTIVGYLKGKSTMIIFERYRRLRRNFKGNSFWARGYYVNTVGLDEAKIRRYIKNQQTNESVMDEYDSNMDKDPFKGASSKKEAPDKVLFGESCHLPFRIGTLLRLAAADKFLFSVAMGNPFLIARSK